MSERKPQPIIPIREHNRCPVCGEVSYSRAGVHPQCLMRQADERQKSRIKHEKQLAKEEKTAMPASGMAPWQRKCPKCNAVQHVRKSVCGCGYTFITRARPPTCKGERT